ncbi:TPA: hypothetical protein ACX6NP_000821, partial [Photobacterium damselae]
MSLIALFCFKVFIKRVKSNSTQKRGITESALISELAEIANSLLDKTLLDSQLYSGWLILGNVLVTSSQITFRVQKD